MVNPCVLLTKMNNCCNSAVLAVIVLIDCVLMVPSALLLAVHVLLGCITVAVLDSACVSVGSLCVVAGQ